MNDVVKFFLLGLGVVIVIAAGFAVAVRDTLMSMGLPPMMAENVFAVLFFGIILGMLYVGLKTVGRLSRV